MLGFPFAGGGLAPHGSCLAWNPALVYLHFLSDIGIAGAYLVIAGAVALLLYRRRNFPYRRLAQGLLVFIGFCGLTHAFGAVTLWLPYQGAEAIVKAATGLLSVAAATALWRIIPRAAALRADGSTFPIELSVAEAAQNEAHVGIVTDITARKRTEAETLRRDRELTAQTALLRSILNSIQHGIAVYDPDLKLAAWNPRYEAMFPQPPELLQVGTPIEAQMRYLMAHGRMREGAGEADIERWMQRYRASDLEAQQSQTLGDGRTVDMVISRLPDGRVLHTFTDITAFREIEQQLKDRAAELARSNRELEQFAYVASHDLQEPLRTIGSYCELLRRRYHGRLDPDGDKFIGYVVAGAARMQSLIGALLRLSRTGSVKLAIEPVDCRQLVAEVTTDFGAGIAETGAVVEAGALPTVLGDRGMLRQLFQNLIGNALKFRSRTAPRVRIAAEPAGRGWRFSVTDNGIGIDPRFAERVFVIFQRLHTREKYPGTGIGLAICKKIVERHGGQIWIDTERRDGARVVFTIARQAPAGPCDDVPR